MVAAEGKAVFDPAGDVTLCGGNAKFDKNGNTTIANITARNGSFEGIVKASLIYQKFFVYDGSMNIKDGDVAFAVNEWTGSPTILPPSKDNVGKTIKFINKVGAYYTTRSYMGESPIKFGTREWHYYGETIPRGTCPDVSKYSLPHVTEMQTDDLRFEIKTDFRDTKYFYPNILELLATEEGWIIMNCRGYELVYYEKTSSYVRRVVVVDFDDYTKVL